MGDPQPPRRIPASVGAVVAGFALTFVLSVAADAAMHATGVFPRQGQAMSGPLFALAAAYRTAFTVAGGWLTARLAPRRPMAHAWVLGAIGTAVAIAGTLATWDMGPEFGPHWYPILLVVLALPSVWAGARLRVRAMEAG
jgi:hypothetical protein